MCTVSFGTVAEQVNPDDLVAFSAGQSKNFDASGGQTLPFNKVITVYNVANGLNGGRFTCEIPGVYKVQVYSLTQYNSKLFLDLYVNSERVFSLWGHTPLSYAAAGNAAILKLRKYDTVKVVTRVGYTVHLYGRPNQIYTTFTAIQPVKLSRQLASFAVGLAKDQTVNGGQSVVYNKVILDTHHRYSTQTGVYTAPTAGIYIFHFFSLAGNNRAIWLELYYNDYYVCSIYAKVVFAWGSAGNTAILCLNANDKVTVKARSKSSIYGRNDQIYSTFSGSLLTTDDTDKAARQASSGYNIAFSAGLTYGCTVNHGNIVKFDSVFVNANLSYDCQSGKFTVPVSGLYEFNYHALAQYDTSLWLELYHNNNYVNSLYSRSPTRYATAGNTAVIAASARDVITVRAHNTNKLYGKPDEVYCTFSGYLLKPY